MLMGDQMRRAWEDFLGAECARRPVLLVLEDVHYGDLPSVKFVDAALRNVGGPLMILALARTEVHALFPGLWSERALTEVRLGELPQRAGVELVRAVVGDVDEGSLRSLLDRSGGNVLYLEELLRAHADGRDDGLPPTVLAMVQLRVESFPAEARRLLRAGSVFGEAFWLGGLLALYGDEAGERDLGEWLRVLVEKEVLSRRLDARFPGEEEYVFRHALVREAACAMWTEPDLAQAHRAAGAWLERRGESDAMLLAEHFDRGGEPERAVTWFWRAAERLARGAAGPVAAALELPAAQAHAWSGAFGPGSARARAAMALAEPKGDIWAHAVGQVALLAGKLGDHAALAELAGAWPPGPLSGPILDGAARLATALLLLGNGDDAARITPRLELSAEERAELDPTVAARVDAARSIAFASAGDVGGYLHVCETAVAAYDQAGDLRGSLGPRVNVGFALVELGAYPATVATLRETLAAARRLGVAAVAGALLNLGWALGRAGVLGEALAVERESAELFRAQGARYYVGSAELYMGRILLAIGDVPAAVRVLESACVLLEVSAPQKSYARAALAEALLKLGRTGEALAEAQAAATTLEALGKIHEGESYVRLMHGQVLRAASRIDGAGLVLERARTRILDRAARISDVALRQQFLTVVPENRATVLGGDEGTYLGRTR